MVSVDSGEQAGITPKRTGDLITLIRGRRSVRKYLDRPVAHELLLQMIEAACWAPSPHGRQPWRFAILTQPKPKAQLAEQMGQTWQANLQMDGEAEEIVAMRLTKSR